MSSLDKLPATVKEFENLAKKYETFEAFDTEIRTIATKVWSGELMGTPADGGNEELTKLGYQYYDMGSFQDEVSRYGQLAWGHARSAADPGPQPNAHLTGTPAEGDYLPGDPNVAPWKTQNEKSEVS